MFRSRNKEHESNKNALPCLLVTLFQLVVGSLFSVSMFIFEVGNSGEEVGNTKIDPKFH